MMVVTVKVAGLEEVVDGVVAFGVGGNGVGKMWGGELCIRAKKMYIMFG